MNETILYCERCGKLIPPEEAEAEDFRAVGITPICPRCLDQADPERKAAFDAARSTRLIRGGKMPEELRTAQAPKQMYPPPGSEEPRLPTSPEIRAIRQELISELRAEGKGKGKGLAGAGEGKAISNPARKAFPPDPAPLPVPARPAAKKVPPEPPLEPRLEPPLEPQRVEGPGEAMVLPRQTRLVLWGLLLASAALAIGLLLWTPPPDGPRREASRALSPSGTAVPGELAGDVHSGKSGKPRPTVKTGGKTGAEAGRRQLAEVETIVTLAGETPPLAVAASAIERLRVLAAAGQEPGRSTAAEWLARYERQVDARVRQAARQAAEEARALAAREQFASAEQRLRQALAALPNVSPWARRSGRRRVRALMEELNAQKKRVLNARLAQIEKRFRAGQVTEALALAKDLKAHPEPAFRAAAQDVLQKLSRAEADRKASARQREEAARLAWPRFFRRFDQALASGDVAEAERLCRPPANALLRSGGLADAGAVLAGFAREARAVGELYAAVLSAAQKQAGQTLDLPLRKDRIRGVLKGAKGRQLTVLVDGRAEVNIPVERLAVEGLAAMLKTGAGAGTQPARSLHEPALWALAFARSAPKFLEQANAERAGKLRQHYARLGRPLPAHWARRFALQTRARWQRELAGELAQLRQAQQDGDPESIRRILAKLRPRAAQHPTWLAPAARALLAAAERRVGQGRVKHFVFQNGQFPGKDYDGFRVDQINRYYRNAQRTDVDVHTGLKLGSYNDLQRILLRFDGLEKVLGAARIRKAALELYQTEAPAAAGAVVALFRLKKAWMPDAGSWLHADQRRKIRWQKPGASGVADAASRPEASLRFGARKSVWRSWDVTKYLRDILAGKAKNYGLLMRVLKDEPKYHLRFYPDTDLEQGRDPALRPRLVVEVETFEKAGHP